MREFQLNGVRLRIPEDCLSDPLGQAISSGRYEHQEARALLRHLQANDRVMDLGAGAGYLACLAARVVGGQNVVAVEAGPKMISPLRANLASNGAERVTVVHAAVIADGDGRQSVSFHSRQAFWASAVVQKKPGSNPRITAVPARQIGELLRSFRPSVVILDIEGGEAQLSDTIWPDHMRLLVMEIHPKLYSNRVIKQLFDGLSRSGLTYCPAGSGAETVVFQRVT